MTNTCAGLLFVGSDISQPMWGGRGLSGEVVLAYLAGFGAVGVHYAFPETKLLGQCKDEQFILA